MNDVGRLYRPLEMLCATDLDLAREVLQGRQPVELAATRLTAEQRAST
jgi:hypothetical protein